MSDFTTWRSLVDGEEIGVIPDSVVLPEENDLDNFDGDTSVFEIVSGRQVTGDFSLEGTPSFADNIRSQSGLNRYPEPGEKFACYLQEIDNDAGVLAMFGVQDASNFYGFGFRDDELVIHKDGFSVSDNIGGEEQVSGLSDGEWFDLEVEWQSDGTITLSVFEIDQNSGDRQNLLGDVSATDTDYSSGGVGFGSSSGGSIALNNYRVTEVL